MEKKPIEFKIGLYETLPEGSKRAKWSFRAICKDIGVRVYGFDAAEDKVAELNKSLGHDLNASGMFKTNPGDKYFMYDEV